MNHKLVPASCLTGETISVKGIEGDIQLPTAQVYIESTRFTGQVEVVVIEDLDYDVLLGREIDSWDDTNKRTTKNPRVQTNNYRPGHKTYRNGSFQNKSSQRAQQYNNGFDPYRRPIKQRPQIQYNLCHKFLYEGYCTRPHCRFVHSFPTYFWPHQELRAIARNNRNWRQNSSDSLNWRNDISCQY